MELRLGGFEPNEIDATTDKSSRSRPANEIKGGLLMKPMSIKITTRIHFWSSS